MSTQANYTIKEVSKLSGLPGSTLRYYESIGIIHPIERDDSSKQRVYHDDDVNFIDAIACLSATGMSLEDMKAYLANRTHGVDAADEQIELLQTHSNRLAEESEHIKLQKTYMDLKVSYWKAVKAGNNAKANEIGDKAKEIVKDLKSYTN
jgi:DNA-binding transcriptional MerR regulator